MALKRITYTRPTQQVRSCVEWGGVGHVVNSVAQAGMKLALVQILVAVANIQMRTLKTDVEKGSM